MIIVPRDAMPTQNQETLIMLVRFGMAKGEVCRTCHDRCSGIKMDIKATDLLDTIAKWQVKLLLLFVPQLPRRPY